MGSTIAGSVVARVFDVGVAQGTPYELLTRLVGRPRHALVQAERVPIAASFACFEACLRHTNDPGFPIHVASSVTLEDYAVLGFALMTASSAAHAFELLVRYQHIISDSGNWRAREVEAGVELQWVRAGRRTLGHRTANECAVAELVGGLRRGYGTGFSPERVSFRHPAPTRTEVHERYFACPITWSASHDGVVLERGFLSRRAASENSAMNRHFSELLGTLPKPTDTCAGRVRHELAVLLSRGSGSPGADVMAKRLGMSERSLRRALAEEETSYRELVDELRKTAALDLLRAKKSVTDVAFVLGFSETSAFSRAFRRWHGTSARSFTKER
jgi:AraC-like DNA-binding protein